MIPRIRSQRSVQTSPRERCPLEEAHFASCSQNKGIIQRRLMQVVENLRASRPNPSARRDRQLSSGEASSTDPAARKLNQGPHETPAEVLPDATMALHSNGPIEAILDTGASRCVMGKRLVSGFLSQLDEAVHKKVRVLKSEVRFRFGNNQTLLSEQRLLLPFRTAQAQTLWLGIEVVPGGTPLLFSKRALKQLHAVIDTRNDQCHLHRLDKCLSLQTGPTGLYMIDLAQLCVESQRAVLPDRV